MRLKKSSTVRFKRLQQKFKQQCSKTKAVAIKVLLTVVAMLAALMMSQT
jgi:hypothetical protein